MTEVSDDAEKMLFANIVDVQVNYTPVAKYNGRLRVDTHKKISKDVNSLKVQNIQMWLKLYTLVKNSW